MFKYYIRSFNIKKKPPELFSINVWLTAATTFWRLHQETLSIWPRRSVYKLHLIQHKCESQNKPSITSACLHLIIYSMYNVRIWGIGYKWQWVVPAVRRKQLQFTDSVCLHICPASLLQPLRGQCWSVAVQTFQRHRHAGSTMMMSLTLLLGTLGLLVQGETLFWKQAGSPQWCSAVMEKHWNKQHLPSSIYSPC